MLLFIGFYFKSHFDPVKKKNLILILEFEKDCFAFLFMNFYSEFVSLSILIIENLRYLF